MYVLNEANDGVRVRKVGHGGNLTYDVRPLHVDGDVYEGVVSRGTLHVELREPDDGIRDGKGIPFGRIPVALWVPGGYRPNDQLEAVPDGQPRSLGWLEDPWTRVRAPGLVSVVSLADVPLYVCWVSEPGIAS